MNLDEVRKVYDQWAPYYNPTHSWSLPKRRAARLALGVRPGDRVLDLACGTGLNFSHLHELVGDNGKIIGVDLSPAMLDVARRLITKRGWKNVEVREADAALLPFPDASFERVICDFALNIIPDYEQALHEVRRVLVPGGRFVSLEMQSGPHATPGWFHRVAPICAVDVSHQTLEAIQRVFPEVRVQYFLAKMLFLAVATKER